MPDLTVTGRRLDAPAPPLLVSPPTNADAPGLGPSMLVGVNFPTLGCWKISGTYKGHTLSFVIWVSQHPVPTPAPTPVVPPTPLACTKESDATFLQHVIDAFNRGDQTTLARSFPDDSVSSNVSVPRFSFNQQNGAGFSTDRPSEMLTNFAQRHTQHEVWQLGNVNVGGGGGNVSMTITSDSTPLRTLFGKISFDCPHSWITFWHMTDTAGIAPQLPFVPVMLPDSLPLTNVSDQFTVDDLGGSCDPNAGLQPLTRFIDAFNQGDQQKLATFFSPVPGKPLFADKRPDQSIWQTASRSDLLTELVSATNPENAGLGIASTSHLRPTEARSTSGCRSTAWQIDPICGRAWQADLRRRPDSFLDHGRTIPDTPFTVRLDLARCLGWRRRNDRSDSRPILAARRFGRHDPARHVIGNVLSRDSRSDAGSALWRERVRSAVDADRPERQSKADDRPRSACQSSNRGFGQSNRPGLALVVRAGDLGRVRKVAARRHSLLHLGPRSDARSGRADCRRRHAIGRHGVTVKSSEVTSDEEGFRQSYSMPALRITTLQRGHFSSIFSCRS